MSDPLLDQADALMRRRSFVAGSKTEPAEHPEPTVELAPDTAREEVPILTDVVDVADAERHSGEATGTAAAWRIEEAVRSRLGQLLVERHGELAREIEAWLDEQMPQLVIRAMDGITDHLVALLANRVRDELLPRLEAALRQPGENAADLGE